VIADAASRLTLLRNATRAAHARLETVPLLQRLMSPELTEADYICVLRHLHAFHARIEPAIAVALEGHPAESLLDGTRPRALLADLAWFGADPIPPIGPEHACLPALEDHAAALGALYVVEGSGLGGRVIARHVQACLSVVPGAGASFYGGLSAEAARSRWGQFCALLESAQAAPGTLCDAANASFACLERWLGAIAPSGRGRVLAGMVAS
jgi:heme oxygenase